LYLKIVEFSHNVLIGIYIRGFLEDRVIEILAAYCYIRENNDNNRRDEPHH